MMRYLPFFVVLCMVSTHVFSQNYALYHKAIIKAEEQIFVKHRIQEGLEIYAGAFKEYDFVFLHDCLTAIQIALYDNDERLFLMFIDKATKNGLKPVHLAKIHYINTNPLYMRYKDSIVSMYKLNRRHYIERLDTVALAKMYRLHGYDQVKKNGKANQSNAERLRAYKPLIGQSMKEFKLLVRQTGFPSDKIIGIAQNDIMQELKSRHVDLITYYNNFKDDYAIGKEQFEIEEYNFSATVLYFPLIHHYETIFQDFKLFDDSFFLEQIEKGNIHPKDFAAINDIFFDSYHSVSQKLIKPAPGATYFRTNLRPDELGADSDSPITDLEIDKFRAKYFIAPIGNDRARRKFMKEHGMYFGWGYLGNRS